MTTKKPKREFISLRMTEIVRKQIDFLMERWGENQSRCIIRAIERAAEEEKKASRELDFS